MVVPPCNLHVQLSVTPTHGAVLTIASGNGNVTLSILPPLDAYVNLHFREGQRMMYNSYGYICSVERFPLLCMYNTWHIGIILFYNQKAII